MHQSPTMPAPEESNQSGPRPVVAAPTDVKALCGQLLSQLVPGSTGAFLARLEPDGRTLTGTISLPTDPEVRARAILLLLAGLGSFALSACRAGPSSVRLELLLDTLLTESRRLLEDPQVLDAVPSLFSAPEMLQ